MKKLELLVLMNNIIEKMNYILDMKKNMKMKKK